MESFSIGTIDIIIVVVYLLFIIWWGVKNGKSSDAQSYFLAGRSMPWWVVGLSLFAASISSTTLIGQSGDAYDTGLAVFNYNLTGIVVMVFFAVFLLPLYIRSKVFTIHLFENDDILVKLIRPLSDNATPWLGLIVGMPILGIYFWANNQTLVQRVLSARTIDEGRRGVIFTGFLTMSTLFIIAIPGLIARDLFPGLDKPDMVYPNMVMQLMPVGLLGIMLAALLSALTSTISAILNSTSTLFTMDFYAKFNKHADTKKLVLVGKIASCVIILLAALWAPQIGKFGSLLKYYQEMLSYISPPIVAAFLLGIFNKRVNGGGAFMGLILGLVVAVLLLFFKNTVFGDLHFLLMVPFLLIFSIIVIYISSFFYAAPGKDKLTDTTFSFSDLKEEYVTLKTVVWYKNYQVWAGVLLVLSALIWIIFQ